MYSFDDRVAKRLRPVLGASRLDYVQGSVVLPTAAILPAGDTLLVATNDDGREFRQYDELRAALIRAANRVLMYDPLVDPSIGVEHVVDGLLEGSEIAELLVLNEARRVRQSSWASHQTCCYQVRPLWCGLTLSTLMQHSFRHSRGARN